MHIAVIAIVAIITIAIIIAITIVIAIIAIIVYMYAGPIKPRRVEQGLLVKADLPCLLPPLLPPTIGPAGNPTQQRKLSVQALTHTDTYETCLVLHVAIVAATVLPATTIAATKHYTTQVTSPGLGSAICIHIYIIITSS